MSLNLCPRARANSHRTHAIIQTLTHKYLRTDTDLQGHRPCNRRHCSALHAYPLTPNPHSTVPRFLTHIRKHKPVSGGPRPMPETMHLIPQTTVPRFPATHPCLKPHSTVPRFLRTNRTPHPPELGPRPHTEDGTSEFTVHSPKMRSTGPQSKASFHSPKIFSTD